MPVNDPMPVSKLPLPARILAFVPALAATLGRATLDALAGIGRIARFGGLVCIRMVCPPFYARETGKALFVIGYLSMPVVGLTAFFTGGALALQIYAGGARLNAETVVPSIVAIGMVRELGPVLGGLMIAGRVAAALAAEIGTMRVTEQIDALVTLCTDPMRYLAVPRVLAATVSVPLLVAVGTAIGICGGYVVGIVRLGFDPTVYLKNTVMFIETRDIVSGLVKGAVFGYIVALMGCYHGMKAGRGAQGVGRATTNAVVGASVTILIANFVLTELFFNA